MDYYESGSASLRIELKDGTIYVYHGTDGDLLFSKTAFRGDWAKMFNQIKSN
jgi:hypothetical protein